MRELRVLRTRDVDDLSERAAEAFRERATGAGLVDVSFAAIDSPLGDLLIAGTRRGLVRVSFPHEDHDDVVEELTTLVSPRILEAPAMLDEARRELDEYFEGRRERFEVAIDMSLTHGFTRKVLRVTSRIPFGSVSTYRDVARRAGNDRAYPRLPAGSNLRGWVLTIATRKAFDHLRAQKRRPIPVAEVPEEAGGPEPPAIPELNGEPELWGAVRSLPPMQRAAVVHRYVFDLTYEDVGRALGCSEEAARANAYEGRRKLRSMMGGPGGSGPAKRSEAEQAAALPRATRPAGGGARRSFRAEGAR